MKNLKVYTGLLMSAFVLLTGCGAATTENGDSDKLQVVTTMFPQYDFVRQIAGDKVEVTKLMPVGIDVHSFEPTPSDIITINNSDLFIYTGEEMEPWAHRIIESLDSEDVFVLDASLNVLLREMDAHEHGHDHDEDEDHDHGHDHDEDEDHDHGHDHDEDEDHDHGHDHDEDEDEDHGHDHDEDEDHDHGHHHHGDDCNHVFDPHIWTSPVNAKIMVENILNALVEIDPENEEFYRSNTEAYLADLEDLNASFIEVAENGVRDTIYHGGRFAMHYLMDEYGLNYVVAPFEAEPSAALVAQMITEMKEFEIPVIFHEELVDPQISQMISDETGATMLLLHSLHNVSNEDLEAGVTYLSIMEQNVENLRLGLN